MDSKYYESLAERRSRSYKDLSSALEIVKKFIKDQNLILYGGMAIDLALKLKGSGIYPDDTIPDYDFMSPNHIQDSYILADLLHEAGLPNISSIQAIHGTTRKVRVNFQEAADISYMPKNLLDNLPTLEVEGLKIVHPTYQRMDLHLALGNLMGSAPQEVVFYRLNKDLKRLALIQEHYPIPSQDLAPRGAKQKTLTFKIPPDGVIGGFVAIALTIHSLRPLRPLREVSNLYDPKFAKHDGKITITLPPFHEEGDDWVGKQNLIIYTDHFEKYLRQGGTRRAEYYERFLDYRPRTVLLEGIEIADTKGRLVPYQTIEGIKVVNYQWILMYLLERYFSTSNKQFLGYYKLIEDLNLELTVQTYGCCDWSFAFIKSYTELVEYINNSPERTEFREPFGYYPWSAERHPEFTLTDLEVFQIQGQKTKPFKPLELPKADRPKMSE